MRYTSYFEVIFFFLIILSSFFVGFIFCTFNREKTRSVIEVIILGLAFYNVIFYILPPSMWTYLFLVSLGFCSWIFRKSNQKLVYWHLWLILPPLLILFIPLLKLGCLSSTQTLYSYYMVSMANYFKTHNFWQIPSWDYYHPHLYMVAERLSYHLVLGSSLFTAAVSNTFHVSVWKLYYLLSCFIVFCPVILFVCLERIDKLLAWFSYFLSVFSITYLKWPVDGQLPLILGLIFLTYVFFTKPNINFILAFAGMSCSYPPLIPYGLLGPGVRSIFERSLIKKYLIYIFLSFAISPSLILFWVTKGIEVYRFATHNWHNIPGILNLAQLIGLTPHFAKTNIIIQVISYIGILFIFCGVLYCMRHRDLRDVVISFSICILGALYFLVVKHYEYGYYKHAVVSVFLLLILFAGGLAWCWYKYRKIAIFILTFFVTLQIMVSIKFYNSLWLKQAFITPDFISFIEKINSNVNKRKLIMILPNNAQEEAWIAYKFQNKRLSIIPMTEPWGWWPFSSIKGIGPQKNFYHLKVDYILTRVLRAQGDLLWKQKEWVFLANPICYIEDGVHRLETSNAGPFRWSKGKIVIKSLVFIPNARLRLTFTPLTKYTIRVRAKKQESTYVVKSGWQTLEIPIGSISPGDKILITIPTIKRPIDLGINTDTRHLGIAIVNFGLFSS